MDRVFGLPVPWSLCWAPRDPHPKPLFPLWAPGAGGCRHVGMKEAGSGGGGSSRELLFPQDFCHPSGHCGLKSRKIPSHSCVCETFLPPCLWDLHRAPPRHHPATASPVPRARLAAAWVSQLSDGRPRPPLTHPAGLETWAELTAGAGRPVAGGAAPIATAQPTPGLILEHPWVLVRLPGVVACLSHPLPGASRAQLGQTTGTPHSWLGEARGIWAAPNSRRISHPALAGCLGPGVEKPLQSCFPPPGILSCPGYPCWPALATPWEGKWRI